VTATATTSVSAHGATVSRPLVQLAIVEGWRLIRHPAFLVGLVLAMAHQVLLGMVDGGSAAEEWAGQQYYGMSTAWVWLWVGTMVAGACVAGRNRWLAEPDLFPGTPVTESGRLAATSLALAGPAAVSIGVVAAAHAWMAARGGFDLGDAPYSRPITPPLSQSVQVVALVLLAGLVGIGVTRLRRGRLMAVIAVVAVTWVSGTAIWLFAAGPLRMFHPFMYPSSEVAVADGAVRDWVPGDPPLVGPGEYSDGWHEVRVDTAAMWWHLGYITGLALLVVAVTARTTGTSAYWSRILAAGVVVAAACGVVQTLVVAS
jgi:hypothetical protein